MTTDFIQSLDDRWLVDRWLVIIWPVILPGAWITGDLWLVPGEADEEWPVTGWPVTGDWYLVDLYFIEYL